MILELKTAVHVGNNIENHRKILRFIREAGHENDYLICYGNEHCVDLKNGCYQKVGWYKSKRYKIIPWTEFERDYLNIRILLININ